MTNFGPCSLAWKSATCEDSNRSDDDDAGGDDDDDDDDDDDVCFVREWDKVKEISTGKDGALL